MANKVLKGHVIPDAATLRKVATAIKKETKADPKVLAQLKKDPRAFLGARGFPIDSQREMMRENGARAGAFLNGCTITCITTNCCWTCTWTNIL